MQWVSNGGSAPWESLENVAGVCTILSGIRRTCAPASEPQEIPEEGEDGYGLPSRGLRGEELAAHSLGVDRFRNPPLPPLFRVEKVWIQLVHSGL
jgi:hypothetical protein